MVLEMKEELTSLDFPLNIWTISWEYMVSAKIIFLCQALNNIKNISICFNKYSTYSIQSTQVAG
jgi:hypothetical protein